MAPIKDETVDALRDLVNKLESRVEQLEAKLQQVEGGPLARKPKGEAQGVRMILIGAPGAGKNISNLSSMTWVVRSLTSRREGHPGPENQREVLCMPLGMPCSRSRMVDFRMLTPFSYVGDWGYASVTSREEDIIRARSQKDHGPRRSRERRDHDQHDQERTR